MYGVSKYSRITFAKCKSASLNLLPFNRGTKAYQLLLCFSKHYSILRNTHGFLSAFKSVTAKCGKCYPILPGLGDTIVNLCINLIGPQDAHILA